MALEFVVALFESRGIAEDAVNRLKTEGMPAAQISLLMLHETGLLPAVVKPELDAPAVDPLVVGDVRGSFAPLIHNGETAVFVCAHDGDEVDLAVGTMRHYLPLRIRVVAAGEETPFGRDVL